MTDRKRSERVGERVLHEPQNEEQPPAARPSTPSTSPARAGVERLAPRPAGSGPFLDAPASSGVGSAVASRPRREPVVASEDDIAYRGHPPLGRGSVPAPGAGVGTGGGPSANRGRRQRVAGE